MADRYLPPPGTKAGTVHRLRSPSDSITLRWTWNEFGEWFRPFRGSISPERLHQEGWRYEGPVDA